jgi:hypothetical protein
LPKLRFGLVDAFEVESAERDLALPVVFVSDDHREEGVAVEGVDVGARVFQVGRPVGNVI